jgi:uncharacterized protein involved in exopolysaccharide biosynthesis
MDEEIDLREYLLALGRRWKLIVIISAATLVAALAIFFLWPWKYSTSATVVVTHPRYLIDYAGQLRSTVDATGLPLGLQTANDYFLLGKTDALLGKIISTVNDKLGKDAKSLKEIRKMIKLSGDGGTLDFACTNGSAEQAALIANTWSTLYVEQMNSNFGVTADKTGAFAAELTASERALRKAEDDLAAFHAKYATSYIESQLTVATEGMTQRLALANRLRMIEGDASSLRARLETQQLDMPTMGSQLHSLFLEATAFGPELTLPVQLQIPTTVEVSSMTAIELADYLDGFVSSLQQRQTELQSQAVQKSGEVSDLEQQLVTIRNQERLLTAAQDVARQTQSSIAAKIEENRVNQSIQDPEVRLLSPASVPQEPRRPELPMLLILALAGGLFVAVLSAWVAEFLRSPRA